MKFFLIFIFICQFCCGQNFPKSKVVTKYFNHEINDEFTLLENLNDTIVLKWIKEENHQADSFFYKFDNINLFYSRIENLMKSRKNLYYNITYNSLNNVFFVKINTENYAENLCFKKSLDSKIEKIIFKPEKICNSCSISYIKPNHKGSMVAIGLTESGQEITKVYLYDLLNDKLLPDVIENNWVSELGGIYWLDDDSGFYYTLLNSNDITNKDYLKNNKVVIYSLIDKNKKHEVVFSKKDVINSNNEEDFFILNNITEKYVFSRVAGANKYSDIYYSSKEKNQNKNFKWQKFIDKNDLITKYQINNEEIYYLSNLNNGNVISKTNFKEKKFQNQQILVTAPKDETMINLLCVGKHKYFTTIKNGIQAFMYAFDDKGYKKIDLPFEAGSITEIYQKHKNSDELIVELSGWTKPYTRYIFNPKLNIFKEEGLEEKYKLDGSENLRIEEHVVKTHDGFDMPVSIIYHKDMIKNGKNRTIITAYGAYGAIDEALFNFVNLLWVIDGGIYVTAHVRGGGAKGEAWHKGGYKLTKSNSWKDLISATEYLIEEKYTSSNFIGAKGISAGGITLSNALAERPNLFKAINLINSTINVLKLENSANGANNSKEFGSIHIKEEIEHVLNMDAYHKLKPDVKYPTMLITAGLNDARVPAWHSAKFVAKLKDLNQEVYFNCDTDGGHEDSIEKVFRNLAKSMSFFYWQLGHPDYQLKAD
jgi:prolyl oligopeptidase